MRGHLRWGRGVGRVTEGRGAPILQGEGGADPRWAPRRQAILCAATGTLRRGRERSARRGWVGAEGVCRSDTRCHPRGEGAKGKQMCGPCPQLWKGTENASCPASSQWDGGSQPPCWCRGSPKLGPPGSTLIMLRPRLDSDLSPLGRVKGKGKGRGLDPWTTSSWTIIVSLGL